MLKAVLKSLEGLDEALQPLYEKNETDGLYYLKIDGIDDHTGVKSLKNAYEVEKTKRKDQRDKLKGFEDAETERAKKKAAADKKKLTDDNDFESLYNNEKEAHEITKQEIGTLRDTISNGARSTAASDLVSRLVNPKATNGISRGKLLTEKALEYIKVLPDGKTEISGPEGITTAEALNTHLSKTYPYLVDGRQSSGGDAAGGDAKFNGNMVEALKLAPEERMNFGREAEQT